MLDAVNEYIDLNVLQSSVWDNADIKTRTKALNNSKRILTLHLNKYYKDNIPVEHLAEQCIWMLKIDDTLQRSEMGVTSVQIDGISVSMTQLDRTIAPFICRALNIPIGFLHKRRVGSYDIRTKRDNFRGGCLC